MRLVSSSVPEARNRVHKDSFQGVCWKVRVLPLDLSLPTDGDSEREEIGEELREEMNRTVHPLPTSNDLSTRSTYVLMGNKGLC